MSSPLPTGLTFGTVKWWVLGLLADTTSDADALPDLLNVNGRAYVTFDIPTDGLLVQETPTPATILKTRLELLIVNGRLQDKAGSQNVKLLANDSPGLSQIGWTYTISYELDDGLTFGSFSFELSTDEVLDLTWAIPLGVVSPGVVITKGQKGDTGTIAVGTVTTGAAGSAASVTNVGTPSAAILNFAIPRGANGITATVAVGTVTTGAAGSSAVITNVGTANDAIFNFTIPRGAAGSTGPTGPGFTFRGPWAASTVYALRDVVTHDGSVFTVTTAHTSTATPPTPAAPGANLALWAQKGDQGPAGAGAPDATTLAKGSVRLAGDLAGTADAPTVPGLASKAPTASPTFTGTVGGITKSMVGLANVDNTADSAKPVSTAQQTALDAKAPLASPAFTGTPTGITKAHVGLGNVDNTSDVNKPVSTAQANAIGAKADKSAVEGLMIHDGTAGGGTRPTGFWRIRWIGGATRPTNMAVNDIWEHDA